MPPVAVHMLVFGRSIQRIGDSLKKDTSKGGKTGNSAYLRRISVKESVYSGKLHEFFAASNPHKPHACSTGRRCNPSFAFSTYVLNNTTYRQNGCVFMLWWMTLTID